MRALRLAAVPALVALAAAACTTGSPGSGASGLTYAGTVAAPEFPAGLDWLNVERPIRLADLEGRIVLLDFWTQGCINCIHVIPDLQRLEAEFPDQLVVIGVHSAKFEREAQLDAIRQAVLRYGVTHPVVNDHSFDIWNAYRASAWPSSVLIDPAGNVVAAHAGEGVYERWQPVIATMVAEWGRRGDLATEPFVVDPESSTAPPTVLEFPGKVLADAAGGRLFIADTGHDRIVEATLDGEIRRTIGSGEAGFSDGPIATAELRAPQGMALSADGTTLYVADRENHAIRAVDLVAGEMTTLAGTGERAEQLLGGGRPRDVALASPWDLALVGDRLVIAMAGLHQLWVLDLASDTVAVLAGSGAEGIDDGSPGRASLSQPSGLTVVDDTLYFTDPEASAVRAVPIDGRGDVRTIVGTGLFDFGDVDGTYPEARLQHAIGIAAHGRLLVVADTYNHKIKLVDPEARRVTTFAGSGSPGWRDGPGAAAAFAEPSGVSVVGDRAYVADTNNHLIRVVDLITADVATLTLTNLAVAAPRGGGPGGDEIRLPEQRVAPGQVDVGVDLVVPDGYEFNELNTSHLTWSSDDEAVARFSDPVFEGMPPSFPHRFRLDAVSGSTVLRAHGTIYYCREEQQDLCLIRDLTVVVPVVVDPTGSAVVEVQHALPDVAPEIGLPVA